MTVPLEPSWDSLAWAGVLLGGQFARLGPESSGFLHQLLPEAPDPLDVLVPRKRRLEVDGPWQFIRETPGVRPGRSVQDPPRLTVESTVLDLAATIAANAPLTVRACKVAIREAQRPPAERDMDLLDKLVEECFLSEDYREGQAAFLEKRQPQFKGQ